MAADLDINLNAIDNATSVIGNVTGALGGLGSLAAGAVAAGLAAAAVGFAALGAGMVVSVSAALDNEKIQAQLAQTIKSTGGAAGLTAEAANALAQQFTHLAGGSDDAILAIETIGLRAGTISAEQMPAFIQSVVDLGAVMGDTSTAAILLARAQDDPEAAFKRIERATGAYDSVLEEQIKLLVDAGDNAGAVALIMDKLAETTGGAAQAQAETLAGQWEILKGTLGEAAETIGMAVLPILHDLFDTVIAPAIPMITELATGIGLFISTLMSGDIGGAFDVLGEFINNVLPGSAELFYTLGGAIEDLWEALSSNDPQAFFLAVEQLFKDLGAQIGPMLQGVIDAIGAWITENGPTILETLESWGQAFIDWIAPMIPPLLLKLGELEIAAIAWIIEKAGDFGEALLEWGQEFVDWVQPETAPMLAEAEKLGGALIDWIVNESPDLVASLLTWGTDFVEWIGPHTEPMLSEVGTFLGNLTAWIIETGAPELAKALLTWAVAFIDWVRDEAVPKIGPALDEFIIAVGDWVLFTALPAMVQFGFDFVTALMDGLDLNTDALGEKVQAMGQAIIDGVKSGVMGAVGSLIGAVIAAIDSAIDAAKERLGMSSPSKVFQEIGENMAEGLIIGMKTRQKDVERTVQELLNTGTKTRSKDVDRSVQERIGSSLPGGIEHGGAYGGMAYAMMMAGLGLLPPSISQTSMGLPEDTSKPGNIYNLTVNTSQSVDIPMEFAQAAALVGAY